MNHKKQLETKQALKGNLKSVKRVREVLNMMLRTCARNPDIRSGWAAEDFADAIEITMAVPDFIEDIVHLVYSKRGGEPCER